MQTKISPSQSLAAIPKELDQTDWQLATDKTDIAVYYKKGASTSDLIGFKTISYHPTAAKELYDFLKEVNTAMEAMNHLFVLGEVLDEWPTAEDPKGRVVRTSFSMPFPFANREFVHGLHSIAIDSNSYLVAYTPIDFPQKATQKGYVRCPMFISGQRITALPNGLTKVEHLMTYALSGGVSKNFQDRWLLKSHIGAYLKEWRKLRSIHFPPQLSSVNYAQLKATLIDALDQSSQWPIRKSTKAGTVRLGRLPYCPYNIYRTDTILDASLEQLVEFIADDSLGYLPQWNKEFMDGEVVKLLEDSPQKKAWLMKVNYATPFFLSNRSYLYYFSREWLNDQEVLICYNSVDEGQATAKGFVQALLYPSVHYCKRMPDGRTKVEHLLATDLSGGLSSIQDRWLKGALIQAHCRDMQQQERLFNTKKGATKKLPLK